MSEEFFLPPRTFASISPQAVPLDKAKVVVLPVPYDATLEYKSGAREGPQAIIDASQYLELYDHELGLEISEVGIHTLQEVQPLMSGPEFMTERIHKIAKDLLAGGKFVVMLGGEHSLTLGMVRALHERYSKLSVLQLDAHTDLRDEYLGTKYGTASVMRRVWEICPVVPAGIRSFSIEEHRFMQEQRIEPFYAEDSSNPDFAARVVSKLSSQVYISVDLDVFDPSIMSAVGTPEPGGLSWQQVLELLKTVSRHRQIVGFDVMELCPREGPTSCAYLAAKLVYKLIGYSISS
ncbi:MAG TPA: agmatinase [Dehalococcoidia bacterium]|nr:agmatinase [Dehalococcoidia bacterium]